MTYALSNKMRQIKANPQIAMCGDWFTAQGIGENRGCLCAEENKEIAANLRAAFAAWYDNGHTDESDPNTCILRIRLTQGVLFNHGTRYIVHFESQQAE